MEEKDEFELIVSQGKRPIWKTLLAALFFTGMIYYSYYLFLVFYERGFCEYSAKRLPRYLELIAYCFAGGFTFSVMKTVLIDVDKDKLISRFYVGPFSYKRLSTVPDLDYVSVFFDSKEYYQVNLWYKGNKHYNMYTFESKEAAFQFAAQVAIKLNIDLLDATEKGNFHRVDKMTIK